MTQLYAFTVQEVNGEQEYSFEQYLHAENLAEAKEKAEKYVSTWYSQTDNDGNEEPADKLNDETWTNGEINWFIETEVHPVEELSVVTIDGKVVKAKIPEVLEDRFVEYFTTPIPGDKNYSNRHAKCGGLEFVAFPFQFYYCRLGNIVGEVNKVTSDWIARIYEAKDNGSDVFIKAKVFKEKDDAFIWAAECLNRGGDNALPD